MLFSLTYKSDPSQNEFIEYCNSKYKDFKEKNCFEDIDIDFL